MNTQNNLNLIYINVRSWLYFFSSSPYTVQCPNREPRQSGRLTPNKTETPLITQSRHYTNPYFHLSKWNRNSDSVLCWLGVTWLKPSFSIMANICYGNFSYWYFGKFCHLRKVRIQKSTNLKRNRLCWNNNIKKLPEQI